VAACKRIGALGQESLPKKCTVLTHCNAGALATGGYGTALGVIRTAHKQKRGIHVFADETRPFLQGARLTAWELHKSGIDVTLITDNMAAHMMQRGEIQSVIVGADRMPPTATRLTRSAPTAWRHARARHPVRRCAM
jgi:methylthioribose-1-phosphate isomerase